MDIKFVKKTVGPYMVRYEKSKENEKKLTNSDFIKH